MTYYARYIVSALLLAGTSMSVAASPARAAPNAVPIAADGFLPAQTRGEQDHALEMMKRGEVMPYSRIKKIAETQLHGRMVGERFFRSNRGWIYEVRVLRQDGRVVFAVIDAKTGEIRRQCVASAEGERQCEF